MTEKLTELSVLDEIGSILKDAKNKGFPSVDQMNKLVKIADDATKAFIEPANAKFISKMLAASGVKTFSELEHEKAISIIGAFRCFISLKKINEISLTIAAQGQYMNPMRKKTYEVLFLVEFDKWFNALMRNRITASVKDLTLEVVKIYDDQMKEITESMKKDL
jgi:hypothetical protein